MSVSLEEYEEITSKIMEELSEESSLSQKSKQREEMMSGSVIVKRKRLIQLRKDIEETSRWIDQQISKRNNKHSSPDMSDEAWAGIVQAITNEMVNMAEEEVRLSIELKNQNKIVKEKLRQLDEVDEELQALKDKISSAQEYSDVFNKKRQIEDEILSEE